MFVDIHTVIMVMDTELYYPVLKILAYQGSALPYLNAIAEVL